MDSNILAITPVFFSGIIVGMIFFHAGIIAPSLFKTISSAEAGPFLRVIFPKLFMLVLILGATSTLILFASGGSMVAKMVSIITAAFMFICYFQTLRTFCVRVVCLLDLRLQMSCMNCRRGTFSFSPSLWH